MPIFRWSGIDLTGRLHQGFDFAQTQPDLVLLLQRRQVGLMRTTQLSQDWFIRPIKSSVRLSLFNDLLALLEAGIPMPQTLQILVDQTHQPHLRCVLGYMLYQIRDEGISLGAVLQNLKTVFSNLVVVALQAGFAVNSLSQSLQNLCDYLKNQRQIQQELRRALLMPILTIVLFVLIAIFVFGFVVPQFVTIFDTVNAPLDDSTRLVIQLSNFLRSRQALAVLAALWLLFLLAYLGTRRGLGRWAWQKFLLKLPLIGRLIRYQNLFSFLQSVALLIKGGVQALEAFELALPAVGNVVLSKQCQIAIHLISQGTPISQAMQQAATDLFPADVVTLVAIGEESGCLGAMLARAATVYQQRFIRLLQFLLTLVQPLLIILLGVLVALLIFAIYLPVFNLPAIID